MKHIISIIAALLFATAMVAQPPKDSKGRRGFSPEEYQRKMEEFVACNANLTQDEQAKFFPLLKEMFDAQRKISHKRRQMQKPVKDLSEEELKKILEDLENMGLQHKKIEMTYFTTKFPTVLSYKKILKVRWALERYKMEALKQFAPQHGDGNRPPKERP